MIESRPAHRTYLFLGMILCAALVRFIFLAELWSQSYLGNMRISDAWTYFLQARDLLSGQQNHFPFWQAPLYPYGLALFQWALGEVLMPIQLLHVLIGVINCMLVYRLGRTLFEHQSAMLSAWLAVFYAPFWLFDAQPLPANVTVLFYLLMTLFFINYLNTHRIFPLLLSAMMLGASIITHGLAIFLLPVFCCYLLRHTESENKSKNNVFALVVFLIVALLPAGLVCARNSKVAGEFVFVSYNAGVNFYIGNHPDEQNSVNMRNGLEWRQLFHPALEAGANAPAAMNRYFTKQALLNFSRFPGRVFITELKKICRTFSGGEIKRNFPIYPLRENSCLLSIFLFEIQAGPFNIFSFPGGLLIPLMLTGFLLLQITACKQAGARKLLLPGWLALFHLIGMILFFPTTRYRLPFIALMLPYAGLLIVQLWKMYIDRQADGENRLSLPLGRPAAIIFCAWFAVSNWIGPNLGPHPQAALAEHLFNQGLWSNELLKQELTAERQQQTLLLMQQSLEADPSYPEPLEFLAGYHRVVFKDYDGALAFYQRLAILLPNAPQIQEQLREAEQLAANEKTKKDL